MREIRITRHESALDRWYVAHGTAAAHLWPHVEAYADYSESTGSFVERREMPSLRPTLIVNLGASISIIDAGGRRTEIPPAEGFFAGLHDRHAFSRSPGSQHGMHIRLSAPGAAALLGGVTAELANRVILLSDLPGIAGQDLGARLIALADSKARFGLLDEILGQALDRAALPAPEIAWAWERLCSTRAGGASRSIAAIAHEIGWSRRRLSTAIGGLVGHPPRTIARLARFQRLLAGINAAPAEAWAQRALAAGFFDQAHLIHEFRSFSGLTPRCYAARLLPDGGGLPEN